MTNSTISQKPTLRTAVEQCLRGFGYPCVIDPDGIDVRFACRTERGTWRSQFLIDEDSRVLQLFVYLTDNAYRASRQGWVMELVCRLNEAIAVLGHFTLEWKTGTVVYRSALDLRHRDVNAGTVEDMLDSIAFAIDVWHRAYGHVHSAHVSPAAALDAARIAVDVYDQEGVSNDARRALLTVVEGARGDMGDGAKVKTRPGLSLI